MFSQKFSNLDQIVIITLALILSTADEAAASCVVGDTLKEWTSNYLHLRTKNIVGLKMFENENSIFRASYECIIQTCVLLDDDCSTPETSPIFATVPTGDGHFTVEVSSSGDRKDEKFCFRCDYEDRTSGNAVTIMKRMKLDSWDKAGVLTPMPDRCASPSYSLTPKTIAPIKVAYDTALSGFFQTGLTITDYFSGTDQSDCPINLCTVVDAAGAALSGLAELSSKATGYELRLSRDSLWERTLEVECWDFYRVDSWKVEIDAAVGCGESDSRFSPPANLQPSVLYRSSSFSFDQFTCRGCGVQDQFCHFDYALSTDSTPITFAGAVAPSALNLNSAALSISAASNTLPGTYQYSVFVTNDGGDSVFKSSVLSVEYVCGPVAAKASSAGFTLLNSSSPAAETQADLVALFDFGVSDFNLCPGVTFGATSCSTCLLDDSQRDSGITISGSVATIDPQVASPSNTVEEQCFITTDKLGQTACSSIRYHVCGRETVSLTGQFLNTTFEQYSGGPHLGGSRTYNKIYFDEWKLGFQVDSSLCSEMEYTLVAKDSSGSFVESTGFEVVLDAKTKALYFWTDAVRSQTFYVRANTLTSKNPPAFLPLEVQIKRQAVSPVIVPIIIPEPSEPEPEAQVEEANNSTEDSSNSTSSEEPGIDQTVKTQISPDQGLVVDLDKFRTTNSEDNNRQSASMLVKPLTAKITKATSQGLLKVHFSESIEPIALDAINNSTLDLELEPSYELPEEFNLTKLQFTWDVISLRESLMEIQLHFESPASVSPQLEQDKIHLQFLQREAFRAVSSGEVLDSRYEKLSKRIPTQMVDGAAAKSLASSGEATQKGFLFLVVVFFGMDLIMRGAMKYVLLFFSSLMLLVHIPMLQLVLPPNATTFFSYLLPVVMFDVLPSQYTSELVFKFDPALQDELSPSRLGQLQDLGYESHNSILNLGSISIFLGLYLAKVLAFFLIVKPCKNYFKKETVASWKQSVFFDEILSLTYESYMELLISAILNLPANRLQTNGEAAGKVLSMFTLLLTLGVFPMAVTWIVSQSRETLESPSFRERFGVLYEDLKITRCALIFLPMFVLRRVFFVNNAFYFGSLQVVLLLIMNLVQITYFINVLPFRERGMNHLHVFNEVLVTSICLLLTTYTDWIADSELKFSFGWIQVGCLTLMIIINLAVIGAKGYRHGRLVYMRYRNRWRASRRKNDAPTYPIEMADIEYGRVPSKGSSNEGSSGSSRHVQSCKHLPELGKLIIPEQNIESTTFYGFPKYHDLETVEGSTLRAASASTSIRPKSRKSQASSNAFPEDNGEITFRKVEAVTKNDRFEKSKKLRSLVWTLQALNYEVNRDDFIEANRLGVQESPRGVPKKPSRSPPKLQSKQRSKSPMVLQSSSKPRLSPKKTTSTSKHASASKMKKVPSLKRKKSVPKKAKAGARSSSPEPKATPNRLDASMSPEKSPRRKARSKSPKPKKSLSPSKKPSPSQGKKLKVKKPLK